MSSEEQERSGGRLGVGPVAAAEANGGEHHTHTPLVNPRPYRMIIGALAVVFLVAFSIHQLTHGGPGTIGVPEGIRLRWFAAPLAGSGLVGDANVNPPCTTARHDPRAMNVCLLSLRGPLVLGLFVATSASCVREIDALQTVSSRFRRTPIQFAAVAVRTGPASALAAVRSHRWTIPVAYDRDGAVGALYGVAVCPLVEVARRGGIVSARLIGDRWLNRDAIAARIQRSLGG